jgi:hypothetical protein
MCISPDAVLTTSSCVKQFLEETADESNTSVEGESNLDFEGVFVKVLGDFDSELSISDVLYHPSVNFDMVSFEEPKYLKYQSPLSSLSPSCALGSSIDRVYSALVV